MRPLFAGLALALILSAPAYAGAPASSPSPPLASGALTGDVTKAAGSASTTVTKLNGLPPAAIATSGSASDLGTGTVPTAASGALTGDVTKAAGSANTTMTKINGLPPAAVATSGSASDLGTGTLPTAATSALTGDVTKAAGSASTTVTKLNGLPPAAIATSGSASDLGTGTVPTAASGALTGDVTKAAGSANTTVTKINGLPPAAVATSGSASDLGTGTLPTAATSALTGDVTKAAGSASTTVTKLNGLPPAAIATSGLASDLSGLLALARIPTIPQTQGGTGSTTGAVAWIKQQTVSVPGLVKNFAVVPVPGNAVISTAGNFIYTQDFIADDETYYSGVATGQQNLRNEDFRKAVSSIDPSLTTAPNGGMTAIFSRAFLGGVTSDSNANRNYTGILASAETSKGDGGFATTAMSSQAIGDTTIQLSSITGTNGAGSTSTLNTADSLLIKNQTTGTWQRPLVTANPTSTTVSIAALVAPVSPGDTVLVERGSVFGSSNLTKGTCSDTGTACAKNLLEITGAEDNIWLEANASAAFKFDRTIVGATQDKTRGTILDAMYGFSNQGGAVSRLNGILFHSGNGAWPIAGSGCLICVDQSKSGTAQTATTGVGLKGVILVGSAFEFQHGSWNGATGNLQTDGSVVPGGAVRASSVTVTTLGTDLPSAVSVIADTVLLVGGTGGVSVAGYSPALGGVQAQDVLNVSGADQKIYPPTLGTQIWVMNGSASALGAGKPLVLATGTHAIVKCHPTLSLCTASP